MFAVLPPSDPTLDNSDDKNSQQYGTAVALLVIVVILCPLMLFVKPCVAGCTNHDDEENDEIEFTNINRGDGMQEPMMGAEYQAVNADDNSRRITDEIINKRQSQMKDLDRQLKAMGTKEGNHSFGEVFIH
jgi:hypothetical protein